MLRGVLAGLIYEKESYFVVSLDFVNSCHSLQRTIQAQTLEQLPETGDSLGSSWYKIRSG